LFAAILLKTQANLFLGITGK